LKGTSGEKILLAGMNDGQLRVFEKRNNYTIKNKNTPI
jgi:hypothetical protein